MSVFIHTFMQYTYYFNAVGIRVPEENYVAALRKFSVARSNAFGSRCDFGSIRKTTKRIEQFTDIGVTLRLSPMLRGVFCYFSQISICCGRKSEFFHPC